MYGLAPAIGYRQGGRLAGTVGDTSSIPPSGHPLHHLLHRFTAFAGIGAIGTLCHFLVLTLCVDGLRLGPVAGSSLGAIAGALVNYWLNYHWNYRSRRRHRVALTRFLVVATIGFSLNALAMEALAVRLGLHYLLAQGLATAFVLVWNFSANHWWTFRGEAPR